MILSISFLFPVSWFFSMVFGVSFPPLCLIQIICWVLVGPKEILGRVEDTNILWILCIIWKLDVGLKLDLFQCIQWSTCLIFFWHRVTLVPVCKYVCLSVKYISITLLVFGWTGLFSCHVFVSLHLYCTFSF